jgi:hypothetical protein
LEHPSPLASVSFKAVLHCLHGIVLNNLKGAIGAERINYNDIVTKQRRFNASGDINFFVVSQNIN